eukprot:CAMPEP_0170292780 /NCGR_PEP_ID=MMETSP0116_2-20130129/46487_1 /TAXON_ID=400756 /ORGANISM="Durinskia baltica, Strain CSIRO CS-38" /LENGTH=238 /DNA_ID=CAMNT_0010544277 /DNA_START=86 /DNA_END=803 /DNA_ORIENTATION=+
MRTPRQPEGRPEALRAFKAPPRSGPPTTWLRPPPPNADLCRCGKWPPPHAVTVEADDLVRGGAADDGIHRFHVQALTRPVWSPPASLLVAIDAKLRPMEHAPPRPPKREDFVLFQRALDRDASIAAVLALLVRFRLEHLAAHARGVGNGRLLCLRTEAAPEVDTEVILGRGLVVDRTRAPAPLGRAAFARAYAVIGREASHTPIRRRRLRSHAAPYLPLEERPAHHVVHDDTRARADH